jgi:hypothetical protein
MKAVLIAGVVVPIVLHLLSPRAMPWWPDTVSLGIAFGAATAVVVSRLEHDRETRRRLWRAIRDLFASR